MDLSQALQLFANVAVIAGIAFLAFEVRQNSAELRAQSRFNYFDLRVRLTEQMATSQELGRIAVKKAAGEQLTPQERYHSYMMAAAIITAWRYEFSEYRRGNLELKELDIPIKRMVLSDPTYSIREVLANSPTSDFTKFVDEKIAGPSGEKVTTWAKESSPG